MDEFEHKSFRAEASAGDAQPAQDAAAEITDEFECELRDNLRPRPAPPGFAERVMTRVQASEAVPVLQTGGIANHRLLAWPRRVSPVWRAVAAAVLIAAVVLGGYFEHRHQRQIAGERARNQVLLALQITGTSLRAVEDQLNRTQRTAGGVHPSRPHLQERK